MASRQQEIVDMLRATVIENIKANVEKIFYYEPRARWTDIAAAACAAIPNLRTFMHMIVRMSCTCVFTSRSPHLVAANGWRLIYVPRPLYFVPTRQPVPLRNLMAIMVIKTK